MVESKLESRKPWRPASADRWSYFAEIGLEVEDTSTEGLAPLKKKKVWFAEDGL